MNDIEYARKMIAEAVEGLVSHLEKHLSKLETDALASVVERRVKQCPFRHHLLIKLHGRISRMQLSSVISRCRKWYPPASKKAKPAPA